MLPQARHIDQTLLGKYHLDEVLRQTPLGLVYGGVHQALGRRVEFHLVDLSRELTTEQRAGFEKRSAVISRLTHPSVARVYDFGRHEDEFLYRVEERLEGKSLFELCCHSGASDFDALAGAAVALAKLLGHVHDMGLYHLRLSPSALVFVDGAVGADSLRVRHFAGVPWGTEPAEPSWAAPEQFTGEPVGPFTDVYAVGLVLWFALVGAPLAMTSHARQAHLSPEPWRLTTSSDVPDALRDVLAAALCKPACDRPASMATLRELLGATEGRCGRTPAHPSSTA